MLSSALTCDCSITSYNIDSMHILGRTVFNFKDLNLEDTLYFKKILQYFCTSDISYELFPLKTPNFHLHSLLPADDFKLCIELLWLDVMDKLITFSVQLSLRCNFFILSCNTCTFHVV